MEGLLILAEVSLRYEPTQPLALNDVTFEVGASEYVTIWGPRRSGRSSILKVAAGLVAPSRGSVRYAGATPREALGRKGGIGWAVDGPDVLMPAGGTTVIEQVSWPAIGLMSRRRAHERADDLLVRCGLGDLAGHNPFQLSDAERVRLLVARTLMRRPGIVLLDEPTAGVPADEARELTDFLRSLVADGISVLLTTDESGPLAGSRSLALQRGVVRGRTAAPGGVVRLDRRRAPGS